MGTQLVQKNELIKVDSNTVELKKDTAIAVKEIENENQKENHQNNGDIIIKGSSDSSNDFDFHNIVEGDTLSSIHISGNATFEIKNKWLKEKKSEVEKSKEENLNIIAKVARKSVSKETVAKISNKAKKVEKEIKAEGFQAPIYIIFGVILLVFIVLNILIKQFKK